MLGLDIFMAKKDVLHLGSRPACRPPGLSLASLVAQESCRLLDQTLARHLPADPSSHQAGALSGPGKGVAGGDEKGGASTGAGVLLPVSGGPLP